MITKTHHCMIDGVAAVDLATVLMSPAPEATIPDAQPWEPQSAPSRGEWMTDVSPAAAGDPAGIGQSNPRRDTKSGLILWSISEQISAVTETIGAGMSSASESPFNQPIGPHRRFEWTTMGLADVKRVKNALGGTVNDVVLATVAGAVGLFLRGRGFSHKEIAQLDFRAMVPVSVRGSSEHGTLGNRIASWAARLPIAQPTVPAAGGGPPSHGRSQRVAAGDGSRGASAGQRVDGGHTRRRWRCAWRRRRARSI